MPARSKVKLLLPDELRQELEQKLQERGFSGYEALSAWLSARGYEISKSALQRYGHKLEEQLKDMESAIAKAKAITERFPDDENSVELATTKLAAHKLYQVVKNLDDSGNEVTVSQAARAIADLNRSSISLQKYRREVKEKAKAVAKEVEQKAKSEGLSQEAIAQIKDKILGVADA